MDSSDYNLKIIPPLAITDSLLDSTNVTETDYSDWNSGTTYAIGDTVQLTTGVHKVYEALTANTNKNPTDNPDDWLELESTNPWKMFDIYSAGATSNVNTIVVSITPGEVVNAIAFFGLAGVTVRVQMTDPTAGSVYDETLNIISSPNVTNWYEYWFSKFGLNTELVKSYLPSYRDATITVTITAEAGNAAECQQLVLGQSVALGISLFGTSVGVLDYSRKEADTFGNAIYVQRKYAPTVDFDVIMLTSDVRTAQRNLSANRGPVCWVGSEQTDYASTLVFGWYKDFSIVFSNAHTSDCSINVEGI